MKKIINLGTILTIFSLMFVGFSINAEENALQNTTRVRQINASSTPKNIEAIREENKEKINSIKDQVKAKIEALKTNRKAKIEQANRERIADYAEKITKRFTEANERTADLNARVESRIVKLSANGIDTTLSKTALTLAKTKLETAKLEVEKLKTEIINSLSSSESVKITWKSSNDLIKKVEKLVKEAHGATIQAINSLKPGSNKTATTTIESNINNQ